MSSSTPTKQGDLLNTQSNADGTHNSTYSKLIEREPMQNTPFWIIGTEEEGYFATLGKYQITEKFPTKQAVKDHIDTQVWEIIMKIVGIIASDMIMENDRVNQKRNPITKI